MCKIYKIEENGMYDNVIRYYSFLVENNIGPDDITFTEFYKKHYVEFDSEYILFDDFDKVIGNGVLDNTDNDSLNVYINISEQHQGQGLGTKLVRRMIEDMKKRTTVRSLRMHDMSGNKQTTKIANTLGFKEQDSCFEYNNPSYISKTYNK